MTKLFTDNVSTTFFKMFDFIFFVLVSQEKYNETARFLTHECQTTTRGNRRNPSRISFGVG